MPFFLPFFDEFGHDGELITSVEHGMYQSRKAVQATPFQEVGLEKAEGWAAKQGHNAMVFLASAGHFIVRIGVVFRNDVGHGVVGKVLKGKVLPRRRYLDDSPVYLR